LGYEGIIGTWAKKVTEISGQCRPLSAIKAFSEIV
jgi:hypothetical protein